jgi:hypothetical protein
MASDNSILDLTLATGTETPLEPTKPKSSASIREKCGDDLTAALNEATRCMSRVRGIDGQITDIEQTWNDTIADLQRQIETIRAYMSIATSELRQTRSWYMQRLDTFRDDYTSVLPKKLTGFDTPVGRFRRDKCRTTSVHEPDAAVLPILTGLPAEAQDEAITYDPKVSWRWVRDHYRETDEGPVLRWVDTSTGEELTVPAVVTREVAGGDTASIPIIREVPPPSPYTTSIEWHKPVGIGAVDAEDIADAGGDEEAITDGDD